ncbi:MAG: cysteine hydrolase [Proteobacteria bacterium]|nr:cysteine hydrolase [Pseudomonadota bacterium]
MTAPASSAAKARQRPLAEKVAPHNTALIVIDMQNDFCHEDGFYGQRGADLSRMPAVAGHIESLVAEARRQRMLILWVRAHYDEIVMGDPMGEVLNRPGRTSGSCLAETFGADWYGTLRPAETDNELVVTKHRYSAFWDSPIDLYLRNNAIENLVVTGTSTDVCVESTMRDAFFRNYFVVVPTDATYSSPERHAEAIGDIGRFLGETPSSDDVLPFWKSSDPNGPRTWTPEAKRASAPGDFESLVDPRHTAFVIVDMQNDFCHAAGVMGRHGEDLSDFPAAIETIKGLLAAARTSGALVIHVQGTNMATARAASHRGLVSEQQKVMQLTMPGTWGAEQLDSLAPIDGEEIVIKHRYIGFVDTRLETLLRSNHIRTLVVTGTATQTCVESTVRDGQMRDYRIVIPQDGVASRGRHQHLKKASLETMGLYFADVVKAEAVSIAWDARRANR